MAELYFMRHAQRIDQVAKSSTNPPLQPDYQPFDPSLSLQGKAQVKSSAETILQVTRAFESNSAKTPAAPAISTSISVQGISKQHPAYHVKFHLLCDFALSEWVHEKMKNKPPYQDSNDAYKMYNPNIKQLHNKSACSNFRPATMLGNWNAPDLSYLEYQANCKKYFTKLMATYNRPQHIKNDDIIIIVAHGYTVSNILSYFLNHPIFEELPEAKVSYARRVSLPEYVDVTNRVDVEGNVEMTELIECDPNEYTWELVSDCLGILDDDPTSSCVLNLDTDIVYYQTNFLKKDQITPEMNPPSATAMSTTDSASNDQPRISFKMESKLPSAYNSLCPGARNWSPQKANKFNIKNEFRKKYMHSEFFKTFFSLQNHPTKPVTPEISPLAEPSRENSVINLKKLASNSEIYKPIKLKYNNNSSISVEHLNSKVNSRSNSQINLMNQDNPLGSGNSSFFDLKKASLLIDSSLARSLSNSSSKGRRYPTNTMNSSERLEELLSGMQPQASSNYGSPTPPPASTNSNTLIPLPILVKRKPGEPTFIESDDSSSNDYQPTRPFTLSFGKSNISNDSSESIALARPPAKEVETPIPQFQTHFTLHRPHDHDEKSESEGEVDETQYIWFGQNAN
ncbi:uncharacterized protein KQ657_000796 [Scheffersomyces spartinae]|uniref:Phosphoglycerate mutase family protein n=1 Tax=Scheffersomyces spartinae TaxID=45513 RepID=A0A9P8AI12_9ASCO|nr:uncharacterized protein KQ657_000796 [Scheffersomyces spartinae]KAG7193378.1 hypothetical protein KQ657_000796 [Scheffersomyces spartinae]